MNVVYAFLADGRDEQQLLQLDMALAPTAQAKEEMIDRANMEAMKQLQNMMKGVQPQGQRR